MFNGITKNIAMTTRYKDCTCLTCDRDIHHLGIMSHRAAHRRRLEDCRIVFSDGRTLNYMFSRTTQKDNPT